MARSGKTKQSMFASSVNKNLTLEIICFIIQTCANVYVCIFVYQTARLQSNIYIYSGQNSLLLCIQMYNLTSPRANADSECPDQTAHSRNLIRAFAVRLQNRLILKNTCILTITKGPDQTKQTDLGLCFSNMPPEALLYMRR